MSEEPAMAVGDARYILTYLFIGLLVINLLSIFIAEEYPNPSGSSRNQTITITVNGQNIKIFDSARKDTSSKPTTFPLLPKFKWPGAVLSQLFIWIVVMILFNKKPIKSSSNLAKANFLASYGIIVSIVLYICFMSWDIVPIAWSVILIVLSWSFVFLNKLYFFTSKTEALPDNACSKIQLIHDGLKAAIGHLVTVCLTLGLVVATMMTILWALKDKQIEEKTLISIAIVFGFIYSYFGIGNWIAKHLWSSVVKLYDKV